LFFGPEHFFDFGIVSWAPVAVTVNEVNVEHGSLILQLVNDS
jgi:hypothetical protein